MSIEKPSEKEEEYFIRQEFERKKKLAEERERKLKEEERARLKELHWMHCPKCGRELAEVTYQGVKVDKCTNCAGIWLDAGEMEQLSGKSEGVIGGLFRVFKG